MIKHSIDLNAKLPTTLKELGTVVLKDTNADKINYISGNYVAICDKIFCVCDLIDVSTGEVWRIPQFEEEYGVNKCLGDSFDNSFIYVQTQKGEEQPFKKLTKIDLKTKEPLWTAALSKVSKGRWNWTQSSEYIFYTDNKNIFTHSKTNGKMLKKHIRKNEGQPWKPKFSAFSRFFEFHNGFILADGWDTKTLQLTITCLNPLEDKVVWELPLGKMAQTVAQKVIDNVLYMLCSSGKFYKIDVQTGNIISETDTKQPFTKGFGFCEDGDNLSAYVINDPYDKKNKGRFVAIYNFKSDNIVVENFTDVVEVPSYTMDSANGIIQNNLLYWLRGENIRIFDIAKKTEIFHIEAKDNIQEYLFLGNILYVVFTENIENKQQQDCPYRNCILTQFG